MLGRELMQFILDNSLEDEDVVAVDSAAPDDKQQYNIANVGVGESDDGDSVCILTIAE